MEELKKFVLDTTPSSWGNKSSKYEYGFALLRWSVEQPYWCVFACELSPLGISGIGGHYCLEKDANVHEVLEVLMSSGCPVKVYDGFFTDN